MFDIAESTEKNESEKKKKSYVIIAPKNHLLCRKYTIS